MIKKRKKLSKWLFDLFFIIEKPVFKQVTLELTGPICQCEKKNLSWALPNGNSLKLTCNTCDTQLLVPHKQFTAAFKFDEMYPEDEKKRAKEALENDTSIVYGVDKEKKEP